MNARSPLRRNLMAALMGSLLLSAWPVQAQDAGAPDKAKLDKAHPSKPGYSPYAGRNFPTRPYFGDTHLHTGFSMDAGAFGARLAPRDAYRFARGEEITSNSGQPVRLSRPLDFLVVADHSDGMGFFPQLMSGDAELLATPQGRKWYDQIKGGQGGAAALDIIVSFGKGQMPKGFPMPGTAAYRNAWMETIKAAEAYNDPGRFTAFIGFEWTSNTGGNNLHRNVIFRGNGAQAALVEPFTTLPPLGSDNPADLWKYMAATQDKTGSEVLAIAHNGNLSNGRMFPMVEALGKKIDRDYVQTRARWEPLYEMTQTKGTGEAHPFLSPNDELADFELWDRANLDGTVPKTKDMLEFEYARSALKNGMVLEARLGTNPYKFGMIGSSDAHTGLAAMEEDNFFGKTAPQEPSPERMTKAFFDNPKTGVRIMDWEVGASGYAAVWATDNTREAIFDAMKRRETYATTGSRMAVRFFGGWDFATNDAHNRHAGADRLFQGRAHGRRPECRAERQGADLSRGRPEGSDRREPRSDPGHQGLGRQGRQDAGARVRRRVVGRSQAGPRRQAAGSRDHGRRRQCNWTNTIGAPD